MRILIVEDEVNAREGLADLLGKISDEYDVCGKASDGEQGFILARELKPDLIFVDIEMPRLNGLQMIERLKDTGEEPCYVILSGYSDFSYAQKGIRLGVAEYLLKPITYNNLKNIMLEMNNKLNLKKEKAAGLMNDIPKEEILKELIVNKGKTSQAAYKNIKNNIKQEENLYLVNFYLMEKYGDKNELIVKEILNFIEYYEVKTFYYSDIKDYSCVSVFINTKTSFSELIKMLKYNLLFSLKKNVSPKIVAGAVKVNELEEIYSNFIRLQNLAKWSIVLGNDEIINDELISKLKINSCNYPREIENEALHAIKQNDYIRLTGINKKFMTYLKAEIYDPIEIIEHCSNYAFSILTVFKGYNNNFYNEYINEGILDSIRRACSMDELEESIDVLVNMICKRCEEDAAICSLPVRKTVNYIKEYYWDKIALEEIAGRMNLTPEYLSRLFTKEVGKSFSDYLKEYRINKAKKMLADDKLKIYEIAEKAGYSDPKYFCKIFKEVTGMTPKEYMKFY